VPVLLGPVIEALNIQPGGCYMDGTFGRGGHSSEILRHLNPAGRLIAIDRDPEAVAAADPALRNDPRVEIVKDEIAKIREIAAARHLLGQVDGLLLDLGVSSPQLDRAERGFSFNKDGPLDMRMDPTSGISAAEWLAAVDEKELKQVLSRYGEERFAGRIAKAIVARRAAEPIRRTLDLAEIVAGAVPSRPQRTHPATRTFQALRIQVNQELEQLQQALAASMDVLRRHGRLCVISFHSLEDRLVKRFMRNASREPEAWRGMPSIPDELRPKLMVIGKAVAASAEEIAANVRARSAHLRVAERK
jgi:16S rRNA (cytosine1402-N4)-methyltransferase